jgi:hypothetical protein
MEAPMCLRLLSASALAVLTCATTAYSQGSDACTTAQAIAGLGTFAFDNSSATLDGAPDALCYEFGTSNIENDVWFEWTAPSTELFVLETCSQTTVDTKLAAYDGSCAGPILACNDDSCGLQSRVSFAATAGQPYLLRVGTFPSAAGGTGTITIRDNAPVLNPANLNYYSVVYENLTWSAAKAAAEATSFMGQQGHLATITDSAENAFVYFTLAGAELGQAWLGGFQNMNSPQYFEPGGGWEWVTGEPFNFVTWTQGEPNDTLMAEHFLGYWPADQWNDYIPNDAGVAAYVIEFDTGTTSVGSNYCISVVNSTGAASTISGSGSSSISGNNLVLTADSLPSQPGIFIAGPTQAQLAFFNGFLCIDPQGLQRFQSVASPAGGSISEAVDYATSAPGGLSAVAGSSYHYQRWNRDPAGGGGNANFSDGLEVTHTP